MDLEFLPRLIAADEEGLWPAAERAWRDMMLFEPYSRDPQRISRPSCPHINDPAGLIRSIHSRYGGCSHGGHSI